MGQLNAFIDQVKELEEEGELTQEQADLLMAAAQEVIDDLEGI